MLFVSSWVDGGVRSDKPPRASGLTPIAPRSDRVRVVARLRGRPVGSFSIDRIHRVPPCRRARASGVQLGGRLRRRATCERARATV